MVDATGKYEIHPFEGASLAYLSQFDAIVLVSAETAREHPEVLAALARLDGLLDERAMQNLNLAVDRKGRTPAEVARDLLEAGD